MNADDIEKIAVMAAAKAAREYTQRAVDEAAEKAAELAAQKAAEQVSKSTRMTRRDDIKDIVSSAVHETLLQIGVNSKDPIEMQHDFQHLRQWRKSGEELRRKGMLVLLGLFLTGLVSLILVGIKDWFGR